MIYFTYTSSQAINPTAILLGNLEGWSSVYKLYKVDYKLIKIRKIR